MSDSAEVIIHESAEPRALLAAARAALRRREIPAALHYESEAQAALWLAVHKAHSPWIRDERCRALYRTAFGDLAGQFKMRAVGVLSLGCGSGEKDALLLGALREAEAKACYRSHDVSRALALAAYERCAALTNETLAPMVAALPPDAALRAALVDGFNLGAPVLTLMLGLSPNFEPAEFFSAVKIMSAAGPVLLSANLAPEEERDYAAAVAAVLPQYNNPETRAWLLSTLSGIGLAPEDGTLVFRPGGPDAEFGVCCIEARFEMTRRRELMACGEQLLLEPRDSMRVFFSYRYTPALMEASLRRCGLALAKSWLSSAGDEGLFLVQPV